MNKKQADSINYKTSNLPKKWQYFKDLKVLERYF